MRFTVLLLVTLAVLVLDHRAQQLETVRDALTLVALPIQYTAHLPGQIMQSVTEVTTNREELIRENRRLREEQLTLQARLQRFESLSRENERLRTLLNASKRLETRLLIAEFLAIDMDPFVHRLTLNKGKRDEVYVGQPLLDAQGVMGQITHVGPVSSQAMLITDTNHALPVENNRNGLRALARGTGELTRLELIHVPRNADIREGDLLVTSGLGGRFPPDYPVGHVKTITRDPDRPYARIEVQPLAELDRTRKGLLVWVGDPEQDESMTLSESP